MVVGRHEILKSLDQLLFDWETGTRQCVPTQDAKPDLDLVKPRRGGRRKGKGHIGMTTQPLLVFLVSRQIIQNHTSLFAISKNMQALNFDTNDYIESHVACWLGQLRCSKRTNLHLAKKEVQKPCSLKRAAYSTDTFVPRTAPSELT